MYFNTTIVRLKAASINIKFAPDLLLFQYYHSAIKGDEHNHSTNHSHDEFQYYHSAIKGHSIIYVKPILNSFQYYHSAIKGVHQGPFANPLLYFNTTIVRLKVFPEHHCYCEVFSFQYYHSAIKGPVL